MDCTIIWFTWREFTRTMYWRRSTVGPGTPAFECRRFVLNILLWKEDLVASTHMILDTSFTTLGPTVDKREQKGEKRSVRALGHTESVKAGDSSPGFEKKTQKWR